MDGLLSRKVRGRTEELLRLRLDVFVGAFGRLVVFEERALTGGRELKIVLNSLVRQYVEQLHRNQCASVSAVLDNERWVAVPVPLEFQKIVHRLCAGAEQPEALDQSDALVVDGERFCVVAAALVCVQAVSQYVQCANALPSVASEAMGLLAKVSFCFLLSSVRSCILILLQLLKLFNSKAALLILGAEATTREAGLKAISAKHLALCSESVAALRRVARIVRAEANPAAAARLLEAESEMEQHERDLELKLVGLMRDLAAAQQAPGGSLAVLADRTQNLFRILEKAKKQYFSFGE